MATLGDAFSDSGGGCRMSVKAKPSSPRTRIAGFNGSRGEIVIEIAAPPEGGKANRELCRFLKRLTGASLAEVTRGQTDSHKEVFVGGVASSEAERLVAEALDGRG